MGDLSCHIMEKHSEPLMCKECNIDFKSLNGIQIHRNKIHSGIPTEYPCYDCNLSFLSSTDRYGHKVKVHRDEKRARVLQMQAESTPETMHQSQEGKPCCNG